MAWSQSSLFINMATVSDSSWEDFFSGLVNLRDIYENYSLDINLDFPKSDSHGDCIALTSPNLTPPLFVIGLFC